MAKSIKIRAKERDGIVTVKALINHPMETGLRKNRKTGKKIPAHFIREMVASANGQTVLTAHWSSGVSKNPYVSFKYAGTKGDAVSITWFDNRGKSDSADYQVK